MTSTGADFKTGLRAWLGLKDVSCPGKHVEDGAPATG